MARNTWFVYNHDSSGPEFAIPVYAWTADEAAEQFASSCCLPVGTHYLMVKNESWLTPIPSMPEWTKRQVVANMDIVYESALVPDNCQ